VLERAGQCCPAAVLVVPVIACFAR
jgi:hypothetical protein